MNVHTTERALPRSLDLRPLYLNATIVGPRYDIFEEDIKFDYEDVAEGNSFIDDIKPVDTDQLIYVLDADFPDLTSYSPVGKYLVFPDKTYQIITAYNFTDQVLYLSETINTGWATSINPVISEPPQAIWELRDIGALDTVDFYYDIETITYTKVPNIDAGAPPNNFTTIWESYIISISQLTFDFWAVPSYTATPEDRITFFTGKTYRILKVVNDRVVFDSVELPSEDINTFFEIKQVNDTMVAYGNHVQITGTYQEEFYFIDLLGVPTSSFPVTLQDKDIIHFCNGKTRFFTDDLYDEVYESDYNGEFIEYWKARRFKSTYLILNNYNSRTYELLLLHDNPDSLTVNLGDGYISIFEREKDYTTRYLVTDNYLVDESLEVGDPDFVDVKSGDIVRLPLVNLTIGRERIGDGRTFVVDKVEVNLKGVYNKIFFKSHTMDYVDSEWVGNYSVLSFSDIEPIFTHDDKILINIEDQYLGGTLHTKYRILSPIGLTETDVITGLVVDPLNPIGVAVDLALKNSNGYPVSYYGIITDDEAGYIEALEYLQRKEVYCLVPLTQNMSIASNFFSQVSELAGEYSYQITLLNTPMIDEETITTGSGVLNPTVLIED